MSPIKKLAILTALVALAGQASAATSSGCYRVVGVAGGDTLNMRSGPSAGSAIVGRLVPDRHGILSRLGPCVPKRLQWSSRWCPVTHYSGNGTTTGWVKARFVRDTGCP